MTRRFLDRESGSMHSHPATVEGQLPASMVAINLCSI
jgi:hypothetical protein